MVGVDYSDQDKKNVQCFDKFTSAMVVLKACDECFNDQQLVERQCNKGTKIQRHQSKKNQVSNDDDKVYLT